VPFALLAGDREVVHAPSATTWLVLRGEGGRRGEGVLAAGDPDYGTARGPEGALLLREGAGLSPLPGTRAEAEAVGDVVLLGRDATEGGVLKAARSRPRWRAVHLACHGLVNPEQPLLCSLALSPGDAEDGFLTTLEVMRAAIPADLVVLSACETGRGTSYRSEGVVGLARAFMLAGAPRVIVSLWKVDDEATRALMVRFYERWNPRDGSAGLPASTALKRAMEFVESHEKWKHPYYWAAWQLWGLPD
jgi:CHAT domain-containing protein